ncbi:MAG TPA: T9SS type A sorting domain-containing protein [Flavitalea sp.]|nr:T9SS type A sorting domain-containing protein [Flavitalea sp.]
MRRKLLFFVCGCTLMLSTSAIYSQVPGNPNLKAIAPPQVKPDKPASKVSSDLKQLFEENSNAKKLKTTTKPPVANKGLEKYMIIKGNTVVVDITVEGDINRAKAALEKIGVKVSAVFGRVISGAIPIDSIERLESIGNVRFAQPAYKSLRGSKPGSATLAPGGNGNPSPPVISQGDTAQRSYIARNKYRVDGKGVKIGILSDSYNNLGTAHIGVEKGELPGKENPFNYKKPVQVLKDLSDSSGIDEGRGMAEIVHDVAPGAEIAFYTAFEGQADFAKGILDLADAGCKVITDDVYYFAEPFFQDGIIAQAVDMVKKKGVTFFSAAGNRSVRSYESDYRRTEATPLGPVYGTAHNFSSPADAPRYFQPVFIPRGGTFIASFQWDQPFFSAGGAGAESDFDIYLLDQLGNVVGGGTSDNIRSGDPVEVFGYFNNTTSTTFFIVILKYAGPDPSRLKYIMYGDGAFFLTTPTIPGILAPTLVGHAKAEGAIATAAAWFLRTPAYGSDTPQVESFSSLGGVATYFDKLGNRTTPFVRKKPEITTADGGNTSFFPPLPNSDIPQDTDIFPNFFGTSAAAPHAAGVAALMIQAQKLKTITPNQIRGVLSSNTIDMDNIYTPGFDKGFDFNTGTGFILADAAVAVVRFPNQYVKNIKLIPTCSENPATTRNWKITNPNPFEIAVQWFLVGSSQHGKLIAQPGETTFSTTTFYSQNGQVPNIVFIDWEDNFGFPRFDAATSTTTVCGAAAVADIEDEKVNERFIQVDPVHKQTAEVYPNPTTNNFRVYLSFSNGQNIELELFNIEGKRLYQKTVAATGIVDIDASRYKRGIYILHVKQKDFNKTIKLIKK